MGLYLPKNSLDVFHATDGCIVLLNFAACRGASIPFILPQTESWREKILQGPRRADIYPPMDELLGSGCTHLAPGACSAGQAGISSQRTNYSLCISLLEESNGKT